MTLTRQEIVLLRESFEELRPDLDEASAAFYRRLFAIAPELEGMFRTDIENQGMRFMSAVSMILERLERKGKAEKEIERLGEGHAALGVKPAHFAPMRTALIETFSETLGNRFTRSHAEAWAKAYDEIAEGMIAAGVR